MRGFYYLEKNKLSRQSSNHRSRNCHDHSCDCDNWNIDNDCCEWDCNCNHSCKCCDPICFIGPTGPTGPTGPASECCCKDSTLYALQTLRNLLANQSQAKKEITANSFNSFKTGAIDSFINDEVVVLKRQSPTDTSSYLYAILYS